ncbi:pilus assembly PilX N-terminal domain-containing protein [Candidatus Saccharibacteria bacterium]|nr:pilus assembly PilX N-terminal domain-containing protein [Candidatus Saccharibacteria bacterium]
MIKNKRLQSNESGMAAITVTLIILGIVTLIAVGFANLMRREQRQALDQQLSTQAFYAAESGVNIARDAVDAAIASNDVLEINDCAANNSPIASGGGAIGVNTNVSVSCLLIDTTPDILSKKLDTTDSSWVTKVQSANGQPISRIVISWGSTENNAPFVTDAGSVNGNLLLPNGTGPNRWGNTTGVVRAMLIPDTTDRDDLVAQSFHAFLYPNDVSIPSNDSVAYGTAPASQGKFLKGNCTAAATPNPCSVEITGVNRTSAFLRLKAIYNGVNVTVQAFAAGSNTPLELANAQAEIDATGKAADVLRRIKVSVPLTTGSSVYPEFAVEAFESICKRFNTWPSDSEVSLGAPISGSTSGPYQLDPRTTESCKLENFTDLSNPPY